MDPESLELGKMAVDSFFKGTIPQIFEAIKEHNKPKQVVRMARAEIDSLLVKLKMVGFTEEEAQAVLRPIVLRNLYDANYSGILAKAFPLIELNAPIEALNEEWLIFHYERASRITDNDMQALWAKILASEINIPGSFSRQTLNIVDILDKTIAQKFTSIGSCLFNIAGEATLIIPSNYRMVEKFIGVDYDDLLQLESVGLVHNSESLGGFRTTSDESIIDFSYFGKKRIIELRNKYDEKFVLDIGRTILTSPGTELSKICGARANSEYFDYILNTYYAEIQKYDDEEDLHEAKV